MFRGGLTLDVSKVRRPTMECGRVALELQLRKRVGNMRCPVHDGQAIVSVAPAPGGECTVMVSGCCDRFVEEVRENLEV